MKLPIAMVWGNNNGPFIRPVKWVCSIIEDKTIDWEFFGVRSSNKSYGHRFLTVSSDASSGAECVVKTVDAYIQTLNEHYVRVDASERKEVIRASLNERQITIDDGLLNEVTHLTEWAHCAVNIISRSFFGTSTRSINSVFKKASKSIYGDKCFW